MPRDLTMANMSEQLSQIDPLNFCVVQLQPLFNDQQLGNATGFFYYGTIDGKPNHWLVTNWHVVTGRNADDPTQILHTKSALPNRLRLTLVLKPGHAEYKNYPDAQILTQEFIIDLYDPSGTALWYQHRLRNALDVAVMNTAGSFGGVMISGINEIALQNDMAVQIGNEVFVLGYPLGFSHFINTPIWKRGSIASEPILETPESRTRVLIDATTRQGMSGAPVIMREKTHYVAEDRQIKTYLNATRWIGIYASRPNIPRIVGEFEEDRRAEVGYFYKMRCVHDTVVDGIRGPDFGSWP